MDEQTLAWCARLIGCRSVTDEGTRAIAELCAREMLAGHGIEPRLIPSVREGPEQVNLVAVVKGSDGGRRAPLVLSTHLDTVPPGGVELWTACGGNPFAATVREERIYGLGAADTKLDFVAKAAALRAVPAPRRDVWLIATFGEEHGLAGAKELAQSGILPRGALTFVGEPSRLEIITAHKGLTVFSLRIGFTRAPQPLDVRNCRRLTFAGRAAHSSTPALGLNAIQLALEMLEAEPQTSVVAIRGGDAVNKVPASCEVVVCTGRDGAPLGTPGEPDDAAAVGLIPHMAIRALARFFAELQHFANHTGPEEPDFAAPTLTCNPGRVASTDDLIQLDFELRPPPGLALKVVCDGIASLTARLASESEGVTLAVEQRRANPAFRCAMDRETLAIAMDALAGAGLPVSSGVKAGCTEAGIYAAAGLEPVVFGPGPSTGVIHAPNEYNLLEDVEGAIRFYCGLLRS